MVNCIGHIILESLDMEYEYGRRSRCCQAPRALYQATAAAGAMTMSRYHNASSELAVDQCAGPCLIMRCPTSASTAISALSDTEERVPQPEALPASAMLDLLAHTHEDDKVTARLHDGCGTCMPVGASVRPAWTAEGEQQLRRTFHQAAVDRAACLALRARREAVEQERHRSEWLAKHNAAHDKARAREAVSKPKRYPVKRHVGLHSQAQSDHVWHEDTGSSSKLQPYRIPSLYSIEGHYQVDIRSDSAAFVPTESRTKAEKHSAASTGSINKPASLSLLDLQAGARRGHERQGSLSGESEADILSRQRLELRAQLRMIEEEIKRIKEAGPSCPEK